MSRGPFLHIWSISILADRDTSISGTRSCRHKSFDMVLSIQKLLSPRSLQFNGEGSVMLSCDSLSWHCMIACWLVTWTWKIIICWLYSVGHKPVHARLLFKLKALGVCAFSSAYNCEAHCPCYIKWIQSPGSRPETYHPPGLCAARCEEVSLSRKSWYCTASLESTERNGHKDRESWDSVPDIEEKDFCSHSLSRQTKMQVFQTLVISVPKHYVFILYNLYHITLSWYLRLALYTVHIITSIDFKLAYHNL